MPSWDEKTSEEIGQLVRGGMDLAVLPVGATEQHGLHLGTGTDTVSANWVAHRAAERTGVLVLPGIPYGCSLGHTDQWPGTVSLSPITLTTVVLEIARWTLRSGIKRMIFFSGHATNAPSLESAVLQLRFDYPAARFRQIGIWEISPRVLALYTRDGADVHANRGETSLLLHAAPEMVRLDRAFDVDDVSRGRVWSYAMPAMTPTGVVGRPTEASAVDGAMMADALVEDFSEFLRAGLAEGWPQIPAGPVDENITRI
jgi:creatinine amidohydrolase